jgi:predicted transcriptional regulator/adenine/guanine phosphoribosyltransferase-like PRPP-binding protein
MDNKNLQYEIIINTLLQEGVFAISDIEGKSKLSRSSIKNILKYLVDENILKKTVKKGAGVKYVLETNAVAIKFLFEAVDQFMIDEIALAWGVSVATAKKYIKQFVDDGILKKNGLPPNKIIYTLSRKNNYNFTKAQEETLDKYYSYTTADGQLIRGAEGFVYWAENRSGRQDVEKLAQEYVQLREKYYGQDKSILLIDATEKLEYVFGEEVYLKKLFHRDFDALPVFGKTNLSQMIRMAKSGKQNTALMNEIINKIQDSITEIIEKYDIECVGFIPPTVARKVQIMTVLGNKLDIGQCKKIKLSKVRSLVPVQQKSLKKIEDRILNASKTIEVNSVVGCQNILLIDDVTGSGATLNQVAKKLIKKNMAKKVYAFTITGSAKAGVFEVISEV